MITLLMTTLMTALLLTVAAIYLKISIVLTALFWIYAAVCWCILVLVLIAGVQMWAEKKKALRKKGPSNRNKKAYISYLRKGYYEEDE